MISGDYMEQDTSGACHKLVMSLCSLHKCTLTSSVSLVFIVLKFPKRHFDNIGCLTFRSFTI